MRKQTLPPEQRSGSRGGGFLPALCNFLGTVILLAVILTALPLTVPRYLGYEIYSVVSGSMEPEIPVGSVVFVESLAPENVAAGDVIAFQSGESVITHRVMENRFVVGEFVTKGDANAGEDMNAVPYADLIGRVAYHVPLVGRFMMIYASNVGKAYVLVFAACGVMFNILAGRLRERRREKLRRKWEQSMLRESEAEARAASAETGSSRGGKKKAHNTVRRILMVVLLAVFLFSGGTVLYVLHQYKVGDALYDGVAETYVRSVGVSAPERTDSSEEPVMTFGSASLRRVSAEEEGQSERYLADPAPIQVDMAALRAANPDVIGWLYCEGTPINYPVLQAADNDYYLHRSMDGSYSVFGSIFAEATNRPDFQDGNTIVYGHHMKNGSMFACLENWAKQAYYDEHPVMWLLTEEQDYLVVLASGYTTSAYSDVYTVYQGPSELFSQYIQEALNNSNFVPEPMPEDTGRWVLLSTCAYVFDNARYVLHGMLVPAASAGGVPFA